MKKKNLIIFEVMQFRPAKRQRKLKLGNYVRS